MIAAVSSWTKGQRYADDVTSGSVAVSRAIAGVVARHQRDLKEGIEGFHFSESEAALAIDKIETLICHSIGIHAGKPFILEPWQAFGVGLLFGWLRDSDESRRFREVYWSMGRKNGKSTLAAAIAILIAALDSNPISGGLEQVSEVVLAATKKEQVSKVIFAEIGRMRTQSPEIERISKETIGQISFFHNRGFIHCVGSDKGFSGLNPNAVLLDELHEYTETHREFYNTMTTGSGSRAQPINAAFTTAGDDRSFLWLEIYNFSKSVALGEFTADHVLPIIYELDEDDDPMDRSTWIKANPNLGISISETYLEQQAAKAATTPQQLSVFTRYHANRKVSANEVAFDVEQWNQLAGRLSDWNEPGVACGIGIDIGGRDDLAAFGVVARIPTDETTDDGTPIYRFEGYSKAYIGTDSTRDLTAEPFASWVREGLLKVEKHPISAMQADIVELCQTIPVDSIAYDPAGGQHLAEEIEKEGFPIASMAQTYRHFHEPITSFQSAIAEGRFRHTGCPLLTWALQNCVTIQDRQCKLMFDKRASSDKIDPAVALVMGFRRAMCARESSTGPLYMS